MLKTSLNQIITRREKNRKMKKIRNEVEVYEAETAEVGKRSKTNANHTLLPEEILNFKGKGPAQRREYHPEDRSSQMKVGGGADWVGKKEKKQKRNRSERI